MFFLYSSFQHYDYLPLKGNRAEVRNTRDPVDRNGIATFTHSSLSLEFSSCLFKYHETVKAAVLCSAVCICDVLITAGVCGQNIKCVTSPPLSLLHWKRVNQHSGALRKSNSKEKEKRKDLFCINIHRTTKRSLQMKIFAHVARF